MVVIYITNFIHSMSTTFNDMPALCEEILHKVQQLEHKVEGFLQTQTERKPNPNNSEDILLSIDETANYLGLAKSTLYSKVCRREVPHSKRGNRLYFSKKEITEWLHGGHRPMTKDITQAVIREVTERIGKR